MLLLHIFESLIYYALYNADNWVVWLNPLSRIHEDFHGPVKGRHWEVKGRHWEVKVKATEQRYLDQGVRKQDFIEYVIIMFNIFFNYTHTCTCTSTYIIHYSYFYELISEYSWFYQTRTFINFIEWPFLLIFSVKFYIFIIFV